MSERYGEAEVSRKTRETDIRVRIRLGSQEISVETGIGFFDHLLQAAGFHGRLGLGVTASGDLHVDYHHLVEDVGIVLGRAIRKAVGPDPAIERFASCTVPMDDALALVAIDVSGRGGAWFSETFAAGRVRDFDASLIREFFAALAREAGLTLHVRILSGEDTHHRLEAVFKAFGRALSAALSPRADGIPSTKGTLEGGDGSGGKS